MTQNKIQLKNKVKSYLNKKGVKTMELNNGLRIIVLKSSGKYHYCSIELNGVDNSFYISRKPFEFFIINSSNMNEITYGISKYLEQ